jgi:hypothetical protein
VFRSSHLPSRCQGEYRLVHMFSGDVSIFSRGPICKDCLRLKNGTRIGVRVCRSKTTVILSQVWGMQPAGLDKRLVSLVAGTNADNTALELFYVLPPIANRCQVTVSPNHRWLKSGVRLSNLSSFCEVVRSILLQWKGKAGIPMPMTKGWMAQEADSASHPRNAYVGNGGECETARLLAPHRVGLDGNHWVRR